MGGRNFCASLGSTSTCQHPKQTGAVLGIGGSQRHLPPGRAAFGVREGLPWWGGSWQDPLVPHLPVVPGARGVISH